MVITPSLYLMPIQPYAKLIAYKPFNKVTQIGVKMQLKPG